MKYKVGDRVKIKSLGWYNMHCDDAGNVDCDCEIFEKDMKPYLGKVFTIHRIVDNSKYEMEEAFDFFLFTDEMIEGLAEDTITTNEQPFKPSNISLEKEMEWNLPDGYIFKDENGNVINATKIVLEKKKKEYPKTYEECCKIMQVARSTIWFDYDDVSSISEEGDEYECHIENTLCAFRKLLICRDAYWKIAGEEMGLGKPWEPDYKNPDIDLYVIINIYNQVEKAKYGYGFQHCILTFPTAEMRDAFRENFDKYLEFCKELF